MFGRSAKKWRLHIYAYRIDTIDIFSFHLQDPNKLTYRFRPFAWGYMNDSSGILVSKYCNVIMPFLCRCFVNANLLDIR